jgi:threonine aldolase
MRAPVDLRSDTMTRPTPAMREAMARADVGDDVWGEDPTVTRLEQAAAAITGKERALFVPSGTMSNQIALLCHTQRGDQVIAGEGAHLEGDESGAAAAWSGVQITTAGQGGLFTAAEAAAVMKPLGDFHTPRPSLIAVENTHNAAGGRVFPQADAIAIAALARRSGLGSHLDGARIWNASIASGVDVAELAAPFDTVSVCFSKGLGAPVGSALCGRADLLERALRYRKMLGGGMRQAGVLAAAALHALDHHRGRLAEDHAAARAFAARLREVTRLSVREPETNLVKIELGDVPPALVIEAAARRGVLVSGIGPRAIRAVLHLDVPPGEVLGVADALAAAIAEVVSGGERP